MMFFTRCARLGLSGRLTFFLGVMVSETVLVGEAGRQRLPLINALRALAAVLIVWHHFALYPPLQVWAALVLGDLLDWFVRFATPTQVFFVIGGFVLVGVGLLVSFAVSVALGQVCYHWVEAPAGRLSRLLRMPVGGWVGWVNGVRPLFHTRVARSLQGFYGN